MKLNNKEKSKMILRILIKKRKISQKRKRRALPVIQIDKDVY